MDIMRSIVAICMMILVLGMTTTMAAKPFPFDDRPDEVCCYPGYPCCTVPIPPGADEEDNAWKLGAPSPSPSMVDGKEAEP